MNESINKDEFERLLKQPRLLRSLYDQGKVFCELNEQNKVELIGTPDRHTVDVLDTLTEENTNFDHITDDKERAEAYRDLAKQFEEIITREKNNSEENSKELKLTHDQLVNTKELLNRANQESTELKQSIEDKTAQLNQEITKSQELSVENNKLTESLKTLQQQEIVLNERIVHLENLFKEVKIPELVEKLKTFCDNIEDTDEQEELNKTVGELVTNLTALQPTIDQVQQFLQNQKMQVEAKDVIAGIPMFSGDVKLLDGFLNSCELYYNIVVENQRTTVLQIIKAKVTGEALSKAGPFEEAGPFVGATQKASNRTYQKTCINRVCTGRP